MSQRKLLFVLVAMSLFLGSCVNLPMTPMSTPTPVPLNDLMRILDNQEASPRQLVLALFELERVEPVPVKAMPLLLRLLKHDDPEVRVRAINALAYIGDAAHCAVPQIAAHLWDLTAYVRTGAATALDHITHVDLVSFYAKFERGENGFSYDEPEGRISGKARDWWSSEGQYRNWSSENDYCEAQP